jgi:hypothetical protein
MLRGHLTALAILNFVRRINARDEQLSMALDHLSDAKAFGNVGSDSDDVGHGRF